MSETCYRQGKPVRVQEGMRLRLALSFLRESDPDGEAGPVAAHTGLQGSCIWGRLFSVPLNGTLSVHRAACLWEADPGHSVLISGSTMD